MSQDGGTEQSGEFSRDPLFDPAEWFEVIEREQSKSRVLDAMRQFVRRADTSLFEKAVALYVRSARARGEGIEDVLGTLEAIADELEQDPKPGFAQRDTPLRRLVMRGVLLAFYGSDAVEDEAAARAERVERRTSAPRKDR